MRDTDMLSLKGYFTGFSSRSDGSASLRFTTQEVDAATFADFQGHHNLFGTILFKENEIQDEDIPKEDAEEGKTPSKRLRNTLFVLWKQNGEKGQFESYYREQMEKVITYLKGKLEPE